MERKIMDSLLYTKNWNDLPSEVKLMVVDYLDRESRLTLRSCSVSDFQLIESIPFIKIHKIQLTKTANQFFIDSYKNHYNSNDELKFQSFDEFQKKLTSILETVDYIEQLVINVENTTKVLQLKSGVVNIKVGMLTLPQCNAAALLRQVDASTLKVLTLIADENVEIYDLPQAKSAEVIKISSGNIRDDQLMELAAKKFWIASPRNLTTSGICNFIRKCTSDPNFLELEFSGLGTERFNGIYNEFSTSNDLKLENFIIRGPSFPEFAVRFSEKTNMIFIRRVMDDPTDDQLKLTFRKINRMVIELDRGFYKLAIDEKMDNKEAVYFETSEELQQFLTKIMKFINYIRCLEINLEGQTCNWRFVPPGSSKQITVGHIKIYKCNQTNGQKIIDLMEQIEPGYLKCVFLYGESVPREVYDLQQVIQANYIDSTQSDVRDDQLLKLNAETLHFARFMDHTPAVEKLTASGANKFIKTRLLNLKEKNYEFKLVLENNEIYWEFIWKLLEGLDIFTMKTDQKLVEEIFPSEVVLNSEWDDIKLKLIIDGRCIEGRRINV